jgi:hypothetical protein
LSCSVTHGSRRCLEVGSAPPEWAPSNGYRHVMQRQEDTVFPCPLPDVRRCACPGTFEKNCCGGDPGPRHSGAQVVRVGRAVALQCLVAPAEQGEGVAAMTYRCGDYLAMLPLSPTDVVDRALARFGLSYDSATVITIGDGGRTFLPTGTPVTAGELLSSYVELAQPATRTQIQQLADATVCPPDKDAVNNYATDVDAYTAQVLSKRLSILDLLERYPACLAQARPGTKGAVTVRPSNVAFHPPASLDTPLVMVCAGSGLAPFRGFRQDRALQAQEQGVQAAPALLFFGCDRPDVDYLYQDELAAWTEQGIVDVRPAFSAAPVDGATYVQRPALGRPPRRREAHPGPRSDLLRLRRRPAHGTRGVGHVRPHVSRGLRRRREHRGSLADPDAARTIPLRRRRLLLTPIPRQRTPARVAC